MPIKPHSLSLSTLTYKDTDIDKQLASQFVVYHYPLNGNYRWREWQQHFDEKLDGQQFSYYMRSMKGQSGLYVALRSEGDTPPKIKNSEGIELIPTLVKYQPEYNPIWLRLIMRQAISFGCHNQSGYYLGSPLLYIEKDRKYLYAASFDCTLQQLADKETTEVVLTRKQIKLVQAQDDYSGPVWSYSKNNVLLRSYQYAKNTKNHAGGVFYKVSKSSKFKRDIRPFIDLSDSEKLEGSWPLIIKPVLTELITLAARYGFKLQPRVLEPEEVKPKTKAKALSTQFAFSSIDISGVIHVVDLRVNQTVTSQQVIALLNESLNSLDIKVTWQLQEQFNYKNCHELSLSANDRLLVLIDQNPGAEDDRYLSDSSLNQHCAIQHINLNPNDNWEQIVGTGSEQDYYLYNLTDLNSTSYLKTLAMKLQVALKELALKKLLLNTKQSFSETLPMQKECLNEQLVVISEGYLFTVKQDRPVLIPFDYSKYGKEIDDCLAELSCSYRRLMELILTRYPYAYIPDSDDLAKLAERVKKRFTLIINKNDKNEVNIMLQDPNSNPIYILPDGIESTLIDLKDKEQSRLLKDWLVKQDLLKQELLKSTVINAQFRQSSITKLHNELEFWTQGWNEAVLQLYRSGEASVKYKELKRTALIAIGEKLGKPVGDKQLIGLWDALLTQYFNVSLQDPRHWLRQVSGLRNLWLDQNQGFVIVGGLTNLQLKVTRQPSVKRWFALQGQVDFELLVQLLDVDWVRMNQLAGNPCVTMLARRWKEINSI